VAEKLHQELTRSGKSLEPEALDLQKERFVTYVPASAPPSGYALLVFVPPWEDARVPDGWSSVLERNGVIYVSAARAGNDEDVMQRRIPLALLAAHNVMEHYSVDPQRVFIGGFSGGSRVALRIALSYPDVFRGVLLNAGSDPIGAPNLPPSRDLLIQFQRSTRLVYLTGNRDAERTAMDAASQQSMREWCVSDIQEEVIPWKSHDVAPAPAFARALQVLLGKSSPQSQTRAVADDDACQSALERRVTQQLDDVQRLLNLGQRASAEKRLREVDERFGALAAPRSLELSAAFH
jgi:pimeloyl-ACP methyl ester carboxylesterase